MKNKLKIVMVIFLLAATLAVITASRAKFHEPVLGDVWNGSAAQLLGFESTDRIMSVEGIPTPSFEQFILEIASRAGQKISVIVNRPSVATYLTMQFVVPNDFACDLPFAFQSTKVQLRNNSVLKVLGVRDGDALTKIDRLPVTRWTELEKELVAQPADKPLNLDFAREPGPQVISVGVPNPPERNHSLQNLGIEDPAFYVKSVRAGSFAEKLGVLAGDRILMIQGEVLTKKAVLEALVKRAQGDKDFTLAVIRGDELKNLHAAEFPLQLPANKKTFRAVYEYLGVSPLTEMGAPPLRANSGLADYLKFRSLMFKCGGPE